MDTSDIIKALVINVLFGASLAIAISLIFALLLRDPKERSGAIRAAWCVIIMAAFVWTWGVARLNFPTVDQLYDKLFSATAVVPPISKPNANTGAGARSEKPAATLTQSAQSVQPSHSEGEEQRFWGEGTPRGPRGHLTNR